jgi:hypothetical protein
MSALSNATRASRVGWLIMIYGMIFAFCTQGALISASCSLAVSMSVMINLPLASWIKMDWRIEWPTGSHRSLRISSYYDLVLRAGILDGSKCPMVSP